MMKIFLNMWRETIKNYIEITFNVIKINFFLIGDIIIIHFIFVKEISFFNSMVHLNTFLKLIMCERFKEIFFDLS